jgi:hypothetical protein
VSEGTALCFKGRFSEGVESLYEALETTRDNSAGLRWEQSQTRMLLLVVLARLGRFDELRRLQQEGLQDATSRGDISASVSVTLAWGNLAWLAEDRLEIAQSHAGAASRDWPSSGFNIQDFCGFVGRTLNALYAGEAEKAYALSTEHVQLTKRSLLWRIQTARVDTLTFLGASALAMLGRGLGDPAQLMRNLKRCARDLEREEWLPAEAHAMALRAGIALHGGDRETAIRALDGAAGKFDAGEMRAYAAAARDRAARLRGDLSSPELARAAEVFRREGVVAPERMMAMLLPGFAVPSAQR